MALPQSNCHTQITFKALQDFALKLRCLYNIIHLSFECGTLSRSIKINKIYYILHD